MVCGGQFALVIEVLSRDRWVAPQVVAESKVPAFLLRAVNTQVDVVRAGPFGWLLEERIDQVEGPWGMFWPRIQEGWDKFMGYMARNEPPPLAERDVRVRDDPAWLNAAA